ncbi:hypothetical protein L9F63_003646 [Diploptera punctata]|uniref:PRKC apoptosis WT1 regulator protein n=1 Tax=Diploptera punctata TaxID=6984 RepID=A0AAD7ZK67_DIPPU|nr:hypothetical protein L9F63_003646 [Diploptera punctata]
MASSSVSQEDLENDFELSSRRSRIRTARARTVNPPARIGSGSPIGGTIIVGSVGRGGEMKTSESLNIGGNFPTEHDASPKPLSRAKEKRVNSSYLLATIVWIIRANHMNKGKQQQRDRRKLREKRRSTGVVHLPSTESTGGSTGEDEDEAQTAETRRNTQHNEQLLDRETAEERLPHKTYPQRRNKSPSDLEADDEDNQEFDSLNQSDSTETNALLDYSKAYLGVAVLSTNSNALLERAQEENRRLLSLLEDRDRKIASLEARISQLQREMSQEKDRLREENAALIRAMASLATAK